MLYNNRFDIIIIDQCYIYVYLKHNSSFNLRERSESSKVCLHNTYNISSQRASASTRYITTYNTISLWRGHSYQIVDRDLFRTFEYDKNVGGEFNHAQNEKYGMSDIKYMNETLAIAIAQISCIHLLVGYDGSLNFLGSNLANHLWVAKTVA